MIVTQHGIFFANYAVASEITRVSEKMIRRFGVGVGVLQTLASGRKIDSAEFGKYAATTV
jgi:ABC-type anion transport system duplicated permease subunit